VFPASDEVGSGIPEHPDFGASAWSRRSDNKRKIQPNKKRAPIGVLSLFIVGSSFGSRRQNGPASGEHFLKFPA